MLRNIRAARTTRSRKIPPTALTALIAAFGLIPATANAQGSFTSNTGDTAWMLVASALVMFMVPGLALFYSGFSKKKNALNVMMQSMIALPIVAILWVVIGYSLSFAPGNGFLGDARYAYLQNTESGMGLVLNGAGLTIPHKLFAHFQMMFAIIAPALISGAVIQRMKFSAYVVFVAAWSLMVYAPAAHMLWGEAGALFNLGAVDFAGGAVIHLTAGVSALILAILLGKTKPTSASEEKPQNLMLTLFGAGILWFGWFGFNGGSAGGAGDVAVNAVLVTQLAAASAAAAWAGIEAMLTGKTSIFGFVSGAVVGLVAITPAAGYVSPMSAILIGAGAALFGSLGVKMRKSIGYDDTLDVFAIHGIGGAWGLIATGLFAQSTINPAIGDGLFVGGSIALLKSQFLAVGAVALLAAIGTLVIGLALKATIGLRVAETVETDGLDSNVHGETQNDLSETFPGETLVLFPAGAVADQTAPASAA